MAVKIVRREVASQAREALSEFEPLLQRVYASRGIQAADELERSLQGLLPYESMPDIDIAVTRLIQALSLQERILIVGDFDADGATSTTVAIKGLRAMGAKNIDYLVPNRFDFGYGLSPELVQLAAQEKQPDLIVTVDNGVSSVAGVAEANDLGIDVVVTDHHLPGEELPNAIALVNPNMADSQFGSGCLAGVGVVFYTLIALRAKLRQTGWFEQQGLVSPNLANLLDIVALGTVADVVPLDKNNRILVHQGLERIRNNRACPGIQALLDISQRKRSQLVATDLGFALGPRLNAAGRLEDMSLGIECLLADDYNVALRLATQLDVLNQERRALEQDMQVQAMDLLETLDVNEANIPAALVLFEPSWHQGVIGILASRLKERFHRPIICLAAVSENELKGSARSIPGCNIRDALAYVASKHPEVLTKFGGHAMAAGMSLHPKHLSVFQQALPQAVSAQLQEEDLVNRLLSDGSLSDSQISLQTAALLREAGPWGQNFPEPMFDDDFMVVSSRVVGQKHLKLTLERLGKQVDAIAFNHESRGWQEGSRQIRAAYKLDINEFRGKRSVQLIIEHIEPA